MDLKIKDVAELLRVSETTIRRWVAEGKIPSYRIQQQVHFNRDEIENWVMRQRAKKGEEALSNCNPEEVPTTKGSKQFSLYRAIHKGGVLFNIPGATKEEVIRASMIKMASKLPLDKDLMTDYLLDREALQPTSLNNGIGIPHTRDFLLDSHYDIVTVVFPSQLLDYGALDGLPVDILFFLFACSGRRHLHLVAKIAHLASQPDARAFLRSKPTREKLLEYIRTWEGKL